MESLEKKIHIGGIKIRTSNQNNQSAIDIGNLWSQFYAQDISGRFPDKLSKDVFVVYCEYESDYNGMFTVYIGHAIPENSGIVENKEFSK